MTLKNMNLNVIQRCSEHDYTFVCRVLDAVFTQETLRNSTSSDRNMQKTAYARLDDEKYRFVSDLFHERVGNETKRFQTLPRLINTRCASIRARMKRRAKSTN